MDFLKSQLNKATSGTGSAGDDKPAAEKPSQQAHKPASTGEIFSDAKLVAGAAKSTLNNESDKVDRRKVGESAEDLLEAASDYGKLDEKGYGKYVDKAEDYIHQYSTTTTTTTTGGPGGHSDAPSTTTTHESTTTTVPPHEGGGGGDGGSENKYGEYFKKAEGFLK